MSLADAARQFWSAAYFVRRAKDRDTSMALAVLRRLTNSPNATVAAKAEEALRDHQTGKMV